MKAITLHQPYATLMAIGAKTFETRSWKTGHIGPIAVHAAKTRENDGLFWYEPIATMLKQYGYSNPDELPYGKVVSIHVMRACFPTPAVAGTSVTYGVLTIPPEWPESRFGFYGPGRYAWHMPLLEMLDPPIAVRARQGLWNWDVSLK